MELTDRLYILCGFAVVLGLVLRHLLRKERLPDVEFLRIVDKPGKAGDADDVNAFLADSLSALSKGYQKACERYLSIPSTALTTDFLQYSKVGKSFLLRTPKQVYLIAASKHIEEIRKAPEAKLSHMAAGNIIFQTRHTLHPALEADLYHFNVVKLQLTQSIGTHLHQLVNETSRSFQFKLGNPKEWTEKNMYSLGLDVVTRVANRLLVGPELCDNDEFLHYSANYTKMTFSAAVFIRNYPRWMRGWLMYFFADRRRHLKVARKYLLPLIKERLKQMDNTKPLREEQSQKPADALQWLLDMTPPEKRNPDILVQRMVHINVTAIHAPAMTYVQAMFDLAQHTEIHEELRAEMAEVLGIEPRIKSWTKANLEKLIKLDSFIRESARLTPLSATKLERLAVQDYTLSDGTVIPRGTSVAVISHHRHIDEDLFENATMFDAFRFARARAVPGMETQHTFAQATPENMLFGLGKFACPGRHIASAMLKVLLVYTLANYEIKLVDGKPLPQGQWTQKFRNVDFKASVCWKRRVDGRLIGLFGDE